MTAERHVMTVRLTADRYEWLRRTAYERHVPMQRLIDDAIDLLMVGERLRKSSPLPRMTGRLRSSFGRE